MSEPTSGFSGREGRRIVSASPGVYILRYTSTASSQGAPSARVAALATADQAVNIVAAPGMRDATLRGPGDYILVRVERSTRLEMVLTPHRAGGSLDAQFELELIAPPVTWREERLLTDLSDESETAIDVLAHVARRGDVNVASGQWVCGPDAPAPIEGIEVRWPGRPPAVSLAYSVIIGQARRSLPECMEGEFAGTRGQATPVVGLRIRLHGPGASQFEIHAEALFRGSRIALERGRDVELSGPTGREPLVGLRLSIEPVEIPKAIPRSRRGKHVQVFRNGGFQPAVS
jgi:hypothetical protein